MHGLKRFYKDLQKYMHYAIYSAKAELKTEVANSYLNWIWWVLEPLCMMLVYVVVFGYVFHSKEPYFAAFIFIGISTWDFFNRNLVASVKIMNDNKPIISRVYIPKHILILARLLVNAFKMFISFGIVILLMLFEQIPVTWNLFWAIPVWCVLILLTFGLMMILSHLGVFIEDLKHIMTILLRLVFYMTGIFYSIPNKVSEPYCFILGTVNPMAFLINSLRDCIIYASSPRLLPLLLWGIISALLCMEGIHLIYKYENSYIKVL